MTFDIKQAEKKEFTPIPKGNHVGILYSIIDLGHQDFVWKGEKKSAPKVRLTWELSNKTKEFNGIKKPLVIGGEYTISSGSLANLRKIMEGQLGVNFTDSEAANINFREIFKDMIGTPCLVNVVHTSKGEKTYANVASISPLPEGMPTPVQFNEDFIFEIEDRTNEDMWKQIPEFVQKKIMASHEAQPSTLTDEERERIKDFRFGYVKVEDETMSESEILASEIPFN